MHKRNKALFRCKKVINSQPFAHLYIRYILKEYQIKQISMEEYTNSLAVELETGEREEEEMEEPEDYSEGNSN